METVLRKADEAGAGGKEGWAGGVVANEVAPFLSAACYFKNLSFLRLGCRLLRKRKRKLQPA